MIAKVYSRPIIPLLISMISGIVLGDAVPGHSGWSYLLVLTTGGWIFCRIILKSFPKKDFFAPFILFFSLGYILIQPSASPPFAKPSAHSLPFGIAITLGAPRWISVATPIMSEWSVITSQSSGRLSLTGSPVDDLISSPRASRYASS